MGDVRLEPLNTKKMTSKRRQFIKNGGLVLTGTSVLPLIMNSCAQKKVVTDELITNGHMTNDNDMFFKISLAQWSFHKALFAKELAHLDFASKTKSLGIDGVEYVNQFFKDKAEDTAYLNQMNARAADHDITQLLIMVDGEGGLGTIDKAERQTAIENHYKWVDAAKYLGCHSIRVNAYGEGSAEDVASAAVIGLSKVAEYGAKENINVIVENHGGYSSDGNWLSAVMKDINMPNCGTLPDFGNFCTKRKVNSWDCEEEYDKYKGVLEMMPFAKAVSAKTNDFDAKGNEANIDYMRMMQIVKDHDYSGFVGIEYEGKTLGEEEGIIATRDLLKKVGRALS